jgi:histidyl-tRNA synthetase
MAGEQIRSAQGTEDVLPTQWAYWRRLYDAARSTFERYGYGEIRTPVFEDTRLFIKGTGETTEIVEKQMYTIARGDDASITLRPEGTPAVIRAYLQANLHKQDLFQKLYYAGPMFRYERPQRGRLRQFHQLGIEAIGGASPLLDAETISVAIDLFAEVGLTRHTTYINSMGCPECRPAMREHVRGILADRSDELCEEHRERYETNVFRVLDCKKEGCRRVSEDVPPVTDLLCPACADHFAQVRDALGAAGVAFEVDPHLVRGLDYYTRTVYEIKHPGLGARDTICGGGRYDALVEMLGGPSIPCVGFALGAEPALLAMEAELGESEESGVRPDVYVIAFGDEVRGECFALAEELRRAGISADMDFGDRSPRAQMRAANRCGAPVCVLLGPDELERSEATVKDMGEGGGQESVPRGSVVEAVRKLLEG